MKILIFKSFVLVMIFFLTACNSNNSDRNDNSQQEQQSITSSNSPQGESNETASFKPLGSGRDLVKFPENYAEGVLYTTANRGNIREEMYTSREVIEAVQNSQPIPSGAVITLVEYRDGKLNRYVVMEKHTGWGTQYSPEERNGEWEYQEFKADKSVNYEADLGRCFSCHATQERNDFVQSLDKMKSFEIEDLTGSKDSITGSKFASFITEDWKLKEIDVNQGYSRDIVHGNGLLDMELTDNSLIESGKNYGRSVIIGDEEKEFIIEKVLLMIYFNQLKN
jgi:hypothetical protein